MALTEDVTSKRSVWLRVLLAGPITAGLTSLVFAAMPLWVPKGSGGINHLALPLFFMPAIWAVIFFYTLLDRKLTRVMAVLTTIAIVQGCFLFGKLV